jgi:ribosomal protein S18 acetylase RimI-like enzyme
MIQLQMPHRAARKDDARTLATLINIAGEGLPLHVWTGMAAAGESPWDIGQERARRETGAFSYRNAIVREETGQVVACLIGYALPEHPQPTDYAHIPPMFVPLQQLEDLAAGTWYLNAIASLPEHRGRGYGRDLMAVAEAMAHDAGTRGVSLIVEDANRGARRLYERLDYAEIARRPIVGDHWETAGTHWLLLVKKL